MKVKAKIRFRDMKEDKIREQGETFTVTSERGKKLEILGYVEPVAKEKESAEDEDSKVEDAERR